MSNLDFGENLSIIVAEGLDGGVESKHLKITENNI